jgi:hypothetical protein
VRRLALVAALVLAGGATAAAEPVTVLPRPPFAGPAGAPANPKVRFEVVSSTALDPGRLPPPLRPRGLVVDGPDGSTQHLVTAPGRYSFDFRRYAWPPRIAPGEREFVYEQVVWAREAGGVLYVETAHSTYAKSSHGSNGYLSAIDVKRKRLLWRSPALVANADDFVLLGNTIVSGYGFTAEPDYLYALDRRTGRVVGRLLVPSAPDRIARHGSTLTVDTYDRRLVVRVTGA